jgi:hypothetical protein
LVGSKIAWVELDPDLSKSLGFSFGPRMSARVGDAYGVVTLPGEYLGQVKPYETVEISRYGLLATHIAATVVSIQRPKHNGMVITGEPFQMVFKMQNGQDWYPGTNCVVFFHMLGSKPLLVPATALLHEGRQEYLLLQLGKGQYIPVAVYVLDTLGDQVLVIGKIKPGQNIVARGAILMKPQLHKLLRTKFFDMDTGGEWGDK